MDDFTSAQDATLNNVEENPKKNNGHREFWRNLLRTVLGISISIVLTFGTNALLLYRRVASTPKRSIITIWRLMFVGRMSKTCS